MSASEPNNSKDLLILVDDRELASSVPQFLRQLPGVEVRTQRLRVGDYEVANRCVFERKTMTDFAASVVDGRLFAQAQRLSRLEIPAAVILEGRGDQLAEVNVSREALQGAIISLSLVFGLPVLRAVDSAETARLVVYSAQQLLRQERGGSGYHGRRPKQRRRLQLRILQSFPGVGPTKAQLLLDRFGSVEAVVRAGLEALQEVEGVGPKIATGIRDALREVPVAYDSPVVENREIAMPEPEL